MTHSRCLLLGLVALLAPATPTAADAPAGRYTIPASGTVYDTRTMLTWQQVVDANTYTWADGKIYCTNLSLAGTGWRLPTRAELLTLADPTKSVPAVDPTAFPNMPADVFWSSSPYVGSSGNAWRVEFGYGSSSYYVTSFAHRVRCVR